MNLKERIIGISIYVICLFVFCALIGRIKSKNVRKLLFVYTIVLSFMGFFFVPNTHNDLYRVREIMHRFSDMPFETLLNDYLPTSSSPVSLLYYWGIGQLGVDGLLPFITSFIFYSNIFYIFSDYTKKHGFKGKVLSFALLVIMCNSSFIEVISGIRNMLSFSIVLRCIYNEFYNNKSLLKNLIWYILAALIHPASLVLLLFKLVFSFFQKGNKKTKKWFLILSSAIILFLVFRFGDQFISSMAEKADSYITNGAYSYIWETVISALILIAMVVMQARCKKFEDVDEENRVGLINNKNFSRIIEVVIVFLIFEHSIFYRFGNFNLFLNIPIILHYSNKLYTEEKSNRKYYYLYFLAILMITCIRGNLCSLKFWGGL